MKFDEAYSCFETGDYRKAAESFSVLLDEHDEDESMLYHYRGLCMKYLNENEAAFSDLRQALQLNPNNAELPPEYGYICILTGRDSEAEAVLLKASSINPDDFKPEHHERVEYLIAKARAYLACLYTDQDRIGEAAALLAEYDY